ncbi:Beta-lactamase class A [Rubrobacter radiotolerans]|uniref:Beta-lactamase class A n=1 Tax=Rubrobacter radiotolerans TaxID=42256 RepID=A0A023X0W1_RUBRA|nr:Beta-lactamase class A [Rubrobacter radiotolerans]
MALLAGGCYSAPDPPPASPIPEENAERPFPEDHSTTTAQAVPDLRDVPSPPDSLDALEQDLAAAATQHDGQIGVAVVGLEGPLAGEAVRLNDDLSFRSASVIKVLVLYALLREVDAGTISLDERLGGGTVRSLSGAMISDSDNVATNLLVDRLGFERINAAAQDLGLKETRLERHMLDFDAQAAGRENYTSARDTAALLAEIWHGRTLSPESRELALSTLELQTRRAKIPAALPAGTRVANKTGELPGVEHDAAIVLVPDRSFVLVTLTSGDPDSGVEAIHAATDLTYRTMTSSP